MRFLLGGYAADLGGIASGIGVLLAGSTDDALAGGSLGFAGEAVVTSGSPSWIARHPSSDVVYAALEASGSVQAFRRIGDTTFVPFGAPAPTGEATCHVAVAPDGGSLIASCWGDGRVVRISLDAAGRPSAPVIAAPAVDPYGPDAGPAEFAGDIDLAAASRALRAAAGEEYAHLLPDHDDPDAAPVAEPAEGTRPSRAHQAAHLPGGVVATTDLGLDLVRFWRTAADGLRQTHQVVLPRGSGPRHMLWHPSGHLYVVTELSCELFVLAPDASGAWRIVSAARLSPATTAGFDVAAEIAASRDHTVVYAGVRGSNTIAVLRVRGDGGELESLALVESGVDWPRHHVIERDTLLVAGQRSNEVTSLGLDLRTGVPGKVRHRTPAPSPTCLLPLR